MPTRAAFAPDWSWALPWIVGVVAFAVYVPSLGSGFVYDGRIEILEEGFITSLANLPAVLSLKVLGMNLLLGSRPGTLLYLMLNAAAWGTSPWGYHLGSNLLHAVNAGLLLVVLRRVLVAEFPQAALGSMKVRAALVLPVLLFALHPIATEPVAAINYCSDLLVAFFTLLALLAATAFDPARSGNAWRMGATGVVCCLAATMCKEAGVATSFILIAYWFLSRRREAIRPWIVFLGAAVVVTAIFMIARSMLALKAGAGPAHLGGSLAAAIGLQPRLWIFMIGKILVPLHLSADYTLEDAGMISWPLALIGLAAVLFLQGWLAAKSRCGALGVLIFWMGLAAVSNFLPMYRIVADRFYYLPLAGLSLQLMALLLMIPETRSRIVPATAALLLATVLLTVLTFERQRIFVDDLTLWRATADVSPSSWTAHSHLGMTLLRMNRLDEARVEIDRSLQINTGNPETHINLGVLLLHEGRTEAAIAEFQHASQLNPQLAEAHYDLGNIYLQDGRDALAIAAYETALQFKPNSADIHDNLGMALVHTGRIDEAIVQYQAAASLNPRSVEAPFNLGNAYLRQGQPRLAIAAYRRALDLQPELAVAHQNLATSLLAVGDLHGANKHYQRAVEIAPNDLDARRRLNDALIQKGHVPEIGEAEDVVPPVK